MTNLKDLKRKIFINKMAFHHRSKMLLAKCLRFVWNPHKLVIPTGFCPCQCDGYLPTGEWYYFRSRWNTWRVYIAKSEQHWEADDNIFVYEEKFNDEFVGGWIGPLKGYILLNKGVKAYYQEIERL